MYVLVVFNLFILSLFFIYTMTNWRERRGRDLMAVGFITAYAISAYHNYRCQFESRSVEVYSISTLCETFCQWLAAGRWFSPDIPVSSTNTTDRHEISEILLKVALNTINLKPKIFIIYTITNWRVSLSKNM
jgi:hypothetical protein